jgi:hypothetical protein
MKTHKTHARAHIRQVNSTCPLSPLFFRSRTAVSKAVTQLCACVSVCTCLHTRMCARVMSPHSYLSGAGGTSVYIAKKYGCTTHGVDLNPHGLPFVHVEVSRLVGMIWSGMTGMWHIHCCHGSHVARIHAMKTSVFCDRACNRVSCEDARRENTCEPCNDSIA